MRKQGWFGAMLLMLFIIESAFGGRAFVVATNGNDANAGTIAQPWRTLAKANANLIAGDTVFVRAGTYTDPVRPNNSGAEGKPLVYSNYQADVCSLYVAGAVIDLRDKSYVIVEGLRLQMAYFANNSVASVQGGAHNAILNCFLYGGSTHNNASWGDWPAVKFSNTSFNRFIGNFLDRQDHDITSDILRGDGICVFGNSRYNIVEGNTIVNVSHFGIAVPYGVVGESYNIVRDNRAYDCHVGIGNTDATYRCLYEGNQSWAPGGVDTYRGGVSCEFSPHTSIIRYNAFFDDSSSVGSLQRNPGSNNSFVTNTAISTPVDNRVYHNVFMGRSGTTGGRHSLYIQNDDPDRFDFGRNVFANNVIAYPTANAESFPISWQDYGKTFSTVSDTFRCNLLWNSVPGGIVAAWAVGPSRGAYHFTLDDLKSRMPNVWDKSNFEASPLWLDSTSTQEHRTFSLSSNSPCVDRAVPLTMTVSTTRGSNAIHVSDASYFHYNWGDSPYDRGDSISVDGVRAELQGIDYENNILYTTVPVTVAANQGVYVAASYSTASGYRIRMIGSGPDVGATEYGSVVAASQPPGAPVLLYQADGGTGIAVTDRLRWIASPTATSNHVQVSTAPSFLTNVIDQGGITGTSYPLSSLGFSTTYFWRVRALNAAGASPWSSIGQFTTAADARIPPKSPDNIVANGGFESGTVNWTFETDGTGSFTATSPGLEGSKAGLVTIDRQGDDLHLNQAGIILEPATIHRLTFSAYSDSAHEFTVELMKNTVPYANYGLPVRTFPLRNTYTAFSTYFKTANFTTTVNDACLQFWFAGNAATGDEYKIDNISIVKSSAPSKPPAPRFVSTGAAASDQPLTFGVVWMGAADADTYRFQLATDSLLTKTVVDTVVSDTAVTVGPLLAGIRYYQRVRGTNMSGDGDYSNVYTFSTTLSTGAREDQGSTRPTDFALAQNYPNPFNPSTTVQYSLPANSRVVLKVYNAIGMEVATLEDGERSAGTHRVIFDASQFASGVYFYTLRTAGFVETKRMVLLR